MSLEELVANRTRLIETQRMFLEECANKPGVYLDVGSGSNIFSGFTSIDKYSKYPGVLNYNIYNLPYHNDSVDAIHSSHSLEHLPLRHSRKALKDWYRVLKPSGILFLSMPDIGLIMQTLLSDITPVQRQWFMYTLYGWQTGMNEQDTIEAPVDPGQFHCSGHTLKSILEELKEDGYKIKEAYQYEGYGTPGLYVQATK